jgi:hypothetical protein
MDILFQWKAQVELYGLTEYYPNGENILRMTPFTKNSLG